MTLTDLKNSWVDEPDYHKQIHESFCEKVNADAVLKEHRDWVEQNVFGFGERSFWWLWKLICDELPDDPNMLEVGVFKGATLSLWQKLKPFANVWGVSPMNGVGTGWTGDDYWEHLNTIYKKFNSDLVYIKLPLIVQGYSADEEVIERARREYDVAYIDGDHSYEGALADLTTYAPMVKSGGFLVVDDAACSTHQPFGYFQGIEPVCKALDEWLQTDIAKEFEFVANVIHIMVYRRK